MSTHAEKVEVALLADEICDLDLPPITQAWFGLLCVARAMDRMKQDRGPQAVLRDEAIRDALMDLANTYE
jgi:hypothetical protein